MISNDEPDANRLKNVAGCGLAVLAAFVLIFLLSEPFEYGSRFPRPILAVTATLLFASIATFLGLINALKVPERQRNDLLLVVVGLAVSARMVALFTCPILEIDYYRYLWDGKVMAQNVSPYQFSPAEVLNRVAAKEVLPASDSENAKLNGAISDETNLRRLALLATQSESNNTILNRIHYEKYTTIYPPVSQFVFGLTMKWFPDEASVEAHVFAIKFVLILFDIATMAAVLWILCSLKLHTGWLILYAWNPLVIKEVANSGHLDSIATFFLTLSVLAVVRFRLFSSGNLWNVILGGAALGIGIGAKLSPAVLLPALAVMIARRSPAKAALFAATCFAVAVLSLWPMFGSTERDSHLLEQAFHQPAQVKANNKTPAIENKDGFIAFFSKWRMNDPIFSTVYLNLKNQNVTNENNPWFVVTSKQWRDQCCDWLRSKKLGGNDPAFFLTRGLTLGLFGIFYLWQLLLMLRTYDVTPDGQADDSQSRTAIAKSLSRLAWIMGFFLVLQPTVNPWYFVWVAPLICFTQNRAWALVSGVLLIYYARFWFKSLSESYHFAGCDYSGVGLFDHFVVFIEFGVIALLLVCMRGWTVKSG